MRKFRAITAATTILFIVTSGQVVAEQSALNIALHFGIGTAATTVVYDAPISANRADLAGDVGSSLSSLVNRAVLDHPELEGLPFVSANCMPDNCGHWTKIVRRVVRRLPFTGAAVSKE